MGPGTLSQQSFHCCVYLFPGRPCLAFWQPNGWRCRLYNRPCMQHVRVRGCVVPGDRPHPPGRKHPAGSRVLFSLV
jgi:hypothetical protein